MPFGQWLNKRATSAKAFFNKAASHAKTGLAFLNNTILPGATRAHRTIANVSNELAKDANQTNRERLKKVQQLSDLGLERLSKGADLANRVVGAAAL